MTTSNQTLTAHDEAFVAPSGAPEQPTLGEQLQTEKPIQNNDVPVSAQLAAMTPEAFYWTKNRNGEPALAYHGYMVGYLAKQAAADQSDPEELPNFETIKAIVAKIVKDEVSLYQSYRSLDQSDYFVNSQSVRRHTDGYQQSLIEIVYWKDQLFLAAARAEKAGREIHEDRSCQALSGFRDNAIRNAYLHYEVLAAIFDKAPVINFQQAAENFLRMRANMEQKRLLGGVNNGLREAALKSAAAKAMDPAAEARAKALAEAKAAAAKAA